MAKIDRFEELEVWQLGMELTALIYDVTNDSELSKDFSLRDQMRKSAISVPSNIAEGFERNNTKQFLYFLLIAKGSCGELRTQLELTKRLNYIDEVRFTRLNDKCLLTSKQLSGFITYLKNKK